MNTRPRIVIDTNVWVSLILWHNPLLATVLERASTRFEIIGSRTTAAELVATLSKPKFAAKMSRVENQLSLDVMVKKMKIIDVIDVVADCVHPPDNKFLELAASGSATFLITGDNHLLALHPWRDLSILTPRQFIDATQSVE